MSDFYGADQAGIHHARFGDLAADAAALVVDRLHAAELPHGHVTDLGCGSGILAAALLDAGYAVTGVDISDDMVALARTTAPGGDFSVGSVHDLAIGPSVAVSAIGEVLNYATDPRAGLDALTSVASRVFDALAPGGVFAFDVSTPGRNFGLDVRHVFHDHDTWMLGMHATEGEDTLDRRIVILMREPDARYRRVDEHHVLVLYDPAAVTAALETVGFTVEAHPSYVEATASTPPSGWVVFVATKPSA
jgi:2-polyprenyl-3-methyl-5-hydroxy-6-metoxy-1,4-benzoquinol methylase